MLRRGGRCSVVGMPLVVSGRIRAEELITPTASPCEFAAAYRTCTHRLAGVAKVIVHPRSKTVAAFGRSVRA
jgi:threonine dehydrogenase-like Zn-dependent dehydrogenase